jgi:hypothetical protein
MSKAAALIAAITRNNLEEFYELFANTASMSTKRESRKNARMAGEPQVMGLAAKRK